MTLTLLLDMDDTLLTNEMDRFLPVYLKSLSKHLSDRISPETMLHSLMAGTQAMIQKQLPEKRLVDAFDEVFYPGIGHSKDQLIKQISQFYADVYPSLQSVTEVRPAAVNFVKWAFEQGYSVAIATNPLFPRTAIEQRLAWAQLPITKFPFKVVTSYETFHFAKPNPAYLAEILGQLEWPNQPTVMVGNSLTEDIQPAKALGIPAFHLITDLSSDGTNSGDFEQLKRWLKQIEGSSNPYLRTPAAQIALLSSTPATLDTNSSNLAQAQWGLRPQANEWSMGEVFCHLRDVDIEVTIPRIERILQEDDPFLTAEATDIWAEERLYVREDPVKALAGFIQARTQLLQVLSRLNPQEWSRSARHAIFGPTSLGELLTFTFTHDQNHIRQVGNTIRQLKR